MIYVRRGFASWISVCFPPIPAASDRESAFDPKRWPPVLRGATVGLMGRAYFAKSILMADAAIDDTPVKAMARAR